MAHFEDLEGGEEHGPWKEDGVGGSKSLSHISKDLGDFSVWPA